MKVPSHEQLSGIFLPILAFFSANIGSKKCPKRHTITGVFLPALAFLQLLFLLFIGSGSWKHISANTGVFFYLFAYTDFQNFRHSSAQSRTKTTIVNKDASIGGKDDDHWRFQFCYRYWQKNASSGRKRRQHWQKMPEMCSCDGGLRHFRIRGRFHSGGLISLGRHDFLKLRNTLLMTQLVVRWVPSRKNMINPFSAKPIFSRKKK